MDDLAIRQIGRYKLIDVVGRGGMGIVYRAVDETIGRQVAIKMLLGGHSGDEDLLARFHREVRSTANLQHKNIVTVYALDNFEGFPYMVMEYLEGQSIAELIKSRTQLHVVEKIALICQVCDGLQYAHEQSVIHRDVKPANILVLKDGTAKIVDFGIARVGRSETLTRTGQIVGSIFYMSPEQISGVAVDARTDIYSAGVTLYQFLAGELPFKSAESDPQGTFVKILNDPVPPLSKFLGEYPAALDEILGKAMAKDPAERYQTAEDFGYDLSRIQETLKHELVSEYFRQANISMELRNFDVARQKLQEILKIDRRNKEANELLHFVREQIQRQQRSVQIAQFRSQAEIALAGRQYEEALECVEQARRLDPADQELSLLAVSIKTKAEQARELGEALRRGQAALYSGDLDEASQEVQKALELDHGHTEARALETLIRRELGERAKRTKLQSFLEHARQEISNRNFASALGSLQEAQSIDPADSNIRELLTWARRGQEQEKERNELHRYIDEAGRLIGENRQLEALEISREALRRFPEDASLLKLSQLAERQVDLEKRRRAIEEIGHEARKLADGNREQEAIALLQEALKSYSGEPNLEMLLAIIRSESERKVLEKEEQERKIRSLSMNVPSTGSNLHGQEVLARVEELQSAIARKSPMSQLKALAEAARATLNASDPEDHAYAQASTVLREFDSRLAKWKKSCEDLEDIESTIRKSMNAAEADSLLDRARFITDQYGADDGIHARFNTIQSLISNIKANREEARSKALVVIRSMQGDRDLGTLTEKQKEVRDICAPWLDDPLMRSLVTQASDCVQEVRELKQRVLSELERLTQSLSQARSAGQIKLLQEQSVMFSSDFEDGDVAAALGNLKRLGNDRILSLDSALSQLRAIASSIEQARAIDDLDKCESAARGLVKSDLEFEEVADLLRRIQRTVEERRREYGRIEANLQGLVESSANATGQAELDLILARQRDLMQRFPGDLHLKELESRLQDSVSQRRAELIAAAASEPLSDSALIDAPDSFVTGLEHERSSAPDIKAQTVRQVEKRPKRTLIAISAIFLVALAGGGLFLMAPKTVLIRTDPADAKVTVDGNECSSPCTMKLSPGEHRLTATRQGYSDLSQPLIVHRTSTESPLLTLSASPIAASQPITKSEASSGTAPSDARILIRTGIPGAAVFIDDFGAPQRITGPTGEVQVATTSGRHQIGVEKQGYEKPQVQWVVAKSNATAVAAFSLKRLASGQDSNPLAGGKQVSTLPIPQGTQPSSVTTPVTSAPAVESFLIVEAPTGAEIHIDLQPAGHSTGDPLKVKVLPGQRKVDVFLQGYQPFSQIIPVSPGEQAKVMARLNPIPKANPPTNPSVSSTTTGVSEDDRKGIQDLLNRYAAGYDQKNIKVIQSLWPSIPSDTVKHIKDFFKLSKTVEMEIHVGNAVPAGSRVTVECSQTLRYSLEGKEQAHTETKTLYVRKSDGAWLVDFIP
jgi:serine/threonine-protein kinase